MISSPLYYAAYLLVLFGVVAAVIAYLNWRDDRRRARAAADATNAKTVHLYDVRTGTAASPQEAQGGPTAAVSGEVLSKRMPILRPGDERASFLREGYGPEEPPVDPLTSPYALVRRRFDEAAELATCERVEWVLGWSDWGPRELMSAG